MLRDAIEEKRERTRVMKTNTDHPRVLLALFAAAVVAAGLIALMGAKPAWTAEPTFEPATNYPIDPNLNFSLRELTAADLDGDGNAADLAVAGSASFETLGNVAVLSNNGDGTFAAARKDPAGIAPSSVTDADFNRDGKEDLAVSNSGSSNVSILLSKGDGTFQAAKYFPVGSGGQVTTGHFNDDGAVDFVDLAVASIGSDAVSVLLGNGDGTFRAARNFEVGDAPVSVTSGDFNGDGKADLATADDPYNPPSGNIADGVSVLLGNGDGTFKDAWRFTFPVGPDNHANPHQVVSADFDGDGNADLATANRGGGDFGGSGCCNPGYVRVFLSDGDGTFSAGQYLGNAPGMWHPDSLTTADFDQDGITDLAIADDTDDGVVAVSLGNGDGTFNEGAAFTADSYPTSVIAEDLNDDNYPDLAVANRAANPRNVSVLLNIPPPGATTSSSGPSETAGDPQPSFQLASSETNPSLAGSSAAAAGNTTRISVDPSGAQLNTSVSTGPSISSDGRYVVFTSTSPDLVANDTNNVTDIFVRDRTSGTTQRVSVDSSGNQGNDSSQLPSISADGRYVAFTSLATNLVANDTNKVEGSSFGDDVFVRDRDTDADGIFDEAGAVSTERVNVSSSGTQANNIDRGRYRPSISTDGRYVAFTSRAANLVANDTNSAEDVFVRDLATGTTQRVSIDSSGNQANGACNEFACEGSSIVSISSSGRYVAFNSSAFNLVANDTNDLNDIFVRDRDTDTDGIFDEAGAASTDRVNVGGCTTQANHESLSPSISPDGRYVTFGSQATNLVANDTNASPDAFVRDRQTGITQRVSVGSSGTQAHLGGGGSSISADGRFTVFASQALDLVANDTNGYTDVFLRELGDAPPQQSDCVAPTTTRTVSPLPNANGWNNSNVTVTLSAQDNEGGSGVKEIRYSATGTQSIPETVYDPQNPPIINTEGATTITYFATDNAGNRESPAKTFTVKLDKGTPTVGTVSPTNGATDISPTTNVEATFSEAMDADTLTTSTFTLTKQGSTSPLEATVSYDGANKKATLDPASDLEANTSYTARLPGGSSGAKDPAGNALAQERTWSFTSAAPPCTKTGTANAETISGTSGADVICAGGGNDTIKGLGGNDILKGEAGNDTLLGGVGNDTLDGGLGSDTASYSASLTAVNASLATNSSTGEGSDTFVDEENLLGSSKADTLTGTSTNNKLTGGGGNDIEKGGSGNDTVIGSGGADTLMGEGGSDTVNSKDGVNGNDSLDGGNGTDSKVTDTTEKSIVGFP
jgi:Bacterial Ig-like domain/RTX calcium-binding nonapeptide repeat (4 copies)/FG-GAP-like repeat/WD40-like Beta Propeller Repeat